MRSLPILLLLLRSLLAATDATPSCDRSLIKAIDPSKVHFDDATKTITCPGGENSLMAIKFDSTHFASITCDKNDGWKAKELNFDSKEKELYKIADASTQLKIECIEYCAATGVGVGFTVKTKKKNQIKSISCIDKQRPYSGDLQLFYDNKRISNDKAICSLHSGWIYDAYESEAHKKFGIRAFHIDKDAPAQFECRKPCDASLIKAGDARKMHFNKATKTLTCISGQQSLMAVEFKSTRYESITCDKSDGWKGKKRINNGSEQIDSIAEAAYLLLNVACVGYCAATGVGITVAKADNAISVSCPAILHKGQEYQEKLFYDQLQIYRASCSLGNKFEWTFDTNPEGSEYIRRKELGQATPFECRLELPTTNSTTTTETPTTTTTLARDSETSKQEGPTTEENKAQTLYVVGISILLFLCIVIVVGVVLILMILTKKLPECGNCGTNTKQHIKQGKINRKGNSEIVSDVSSGRSM